MRHNWFQRSLLNLIRRMTGSVPVRIEMGTGSEEKHSPASAAIRIQDTRTLLALLLNPQMNFGDLYSEGRIQIEGDMVRLLEDLSTFSDHALARMGARCMGWVQANTLHGSRRNIHHHYDIPTDFYQLWLDPDLVYTCAYFPEETVSLEAAQKAKMDHVCRKVWLKPGESVVEAGCGWGSLAIHMAKYYGVRVKAFNISKEQIAFARERAHREGLSSQVEFIEDDYRNIHGRFDAFVSIGMLEHVGRSHYRELSNVIRRAIGDSGRGLLHFIGRNRPRALSPWIRKRIFPGAYPPALRETLEIFEAHDFSVLDVENLRMHYARTIEWWLRNFERSFDTVVARLGPTFARMWRLYLAGSIAAFRTGGLQLFQVVFAGRECPAQPWTRAYLYDQTAQDVEWIRATS